MFKHRLTGISMNYRREPAVNRETGASNYGGTAVIPLYADSLPIVTEVKNGKTVEKFDVLARDGDSFPTYSPARGAVTFDGDFATVTPKKEAAPFEPQPKSIDGITADELTQLAKLAGIIDETDGQPLYKKFMKHTEGIFDIILADASDEDPYFSAGLRTLIERRDEICGAVELLLEVFSVKRAEIVYCDNLLSVDTIDKSQYSVPVKKLTFNYPAMSRYVEKLSAKQHVLTVGVIALYHLMRYLKTGQVQTDTIITVSGDAIANPQNITVSIGTPVVEVLRACGLFQNPQCVIMGGVIKGLTVNDDSIPVTVATRAVTALTRLSIHKKKACIACGKCMAVCPKKIMPYYIKIAYENNDVRSIKKHKACKCDSCLACSIVCPSNTHIGNIVALAAQKSTEVGSEALENGNES